MRCKLDLLYSTPRQALPVLFRASSHLRWIRWRASAAWTDGDGLVSLRINRIIRLTVVQIFIIEGLMTVVLGFILPFVMWDSPEKAGFFSTEEKAYFTRRLALDYSTGGKDGEKFKWKYLRQALTDWKTYLSVVIFWGNTITGYGFIFSLPTVVYELGYSAANAVRFLCANYA
jgi:hypothetical protein